MSQHRSRPLVASAFAALFAAISTASPAGAAAATPTKATAAASAHAPLRVVPSRPHREVFGYVNMVNLGSSTVGYSTWTLDNLSTVALFGIHVNNDGSFSLDRNWAIWTSPTVAAFISTAHAHGVKVVPSIIFHDSSSTNGGATNTPMCQALSADSISHTVSDILSEIRAKGADGFNLNYEGNNQLCPNGQYQAQMLVSFMSLARGYMPNDYISIATYNGSYYPNYFFDLVGLNKYVDSFFVMDYDSTWSNYRASPLNCSSYCFSPNGPLVRYDYNDSGSVHGYLGVVPASKVIMGVPYYGNTACIPGSGRPGPNATPYTDSRAHWSVPRYVDSSTTNGTPGVYSFATANDPYSPTDIYSTWWDGDYACWRESYWDNLDSLAAKYDLVNQTNIRGVGIFTLDYGGGSAGLWQLLHTKFGGCIGATVSAAPAAPLPPGALIHLSATATGCSNPVFAYWVRYPSGTWVMKRSFGASAFDWNTTGLPTGTYTIHAWANQSGDSTATYQAYGEMTFTLAHVPPCSSASLTPSPVSQLVTTSVTFTASSAGCGTPQYEYWLQSPNGHWSMTRAFSFDRTWTWNTSGLAPGAYVVHVWANQYGDPTGALEAVGESRVTLTGCTSPVLTPVNPTMPAGSTVNFTETASGCTTPTFEYWVLYPNGTWYLKRPFSTSGAWSWSTAGLAPGVYTVHAWANQQGAWSGNLDASGSSTVTLTGCTAASISPRSVTQQGGSTVALSATSSGCPNPQYEYWVRWLDGTWHVLRGFSSDPTFSWTTGSGYALGTYAVSVWANQQGADTSAYEVYSMGSVTLAPACSSAALNPSTGSAAAGTTVTFTASAASCPNPLYEFWLQYPDGTWHMMQAFGSGNTWRWNTTGLAKGTYHVHVWANEPGSNLGAYQVLGYATYTVT